MVYAAWCVLHAARCNGPSGRCLLGVGGQLGDRRLCFLCFLEIEAGPAYVGETEARGTRRCIGQISPAGARRFDAAEPWAAMRGLRVGSIAPYR
jgi:hypothetical protein